MRVAVAAQGRQQPGAFGRRRLLVKQPREVGGLLTRGGLGDDLGGGRADALQGLQRARGDPLVELSWLQPDEHLGGMAERPDAIRRRPAAFELEGDLPQRLCRFHLRTHTRHPAAHALCGPIAPGRAQ
jgi:hypothetical protein